MGALNFILLHAAWEQVLYAVHSHCIEAIKPTPKKNALYVNVWSLEHQSALMQLCHIPKSNKATDPTVINL